jgi:hypothetical protein
MSVRTAQYFNDNPDAYSRFLAKLPRRPTGEPQQNSQTAAPPTGGTWQNVTTAPESGLSNPLLLTDGTVIAHISRSQHWYKLTPDINGSYKLGIWTPIASLPSGYAPLYFSSAVLPNGRVIIQGGEYNLNCATGEAWTSQGAIYDPIANTWTPVNPPSGTGWVNSTPNCVNATGGVGDAAGVVLPNGTFMLSSCCSNPPLDALFNASNLTYSATGSPANAGNNQNEQGYTLLPNGDVLTVDIWTNVPNNTTVAERYNPGTGAWTSAGNTPVSLHDPFLCGNAEIGPAVTRPDGTTVAFGGYSQTPAVNHNCTQSPDPTAIYTASSNSWIAGPYIPTLSGVDYTLADAPAAMLPNGNILFAASPAYGSAPTHFFEFSSGNTIAQVNDPVQFASSSSSYVYNFLVLPNGQILMTDFSIAAEVYTPSGGPLVAWKPTITGLPSCVTPGGLYLLSGTQLNGLSQGAAYGDDAQGATNYPLVVIVNGNSGHHFYARTAFHSSMSIAPGQAGATTFKVAATTETTGASTLFVIANGIASAGTAVTVASSCPSTDSLTATHDFNGDGKSDILFRNSSSGAVVGWLMNGGAVTQNATIATVPTHWQIVAQRDFNGDGKTDILWRDTTTGAVVLWLMNGLSITQSLSVGTVPTHWVLAGASDFNGDGKADILWRDSNTGTVAIWLMNGGTVTQTGTVGTVPSSWVIAGTSPSGAIVWHNSSTGAVALWGMNGFTVAHAYNLGTAALAWNVVGGGDFDGNGHRDLLFRNSSTGAVAIWFIINGVVTSSASLGTVANTWSIDLIGDFDGDGMSDIVWSKNNGTRVIWFMNGATVAISSKLGTVPTTWAIQWMGAE